ncbi:M48 family metallopeptidase [Solimonas variicoloris]|uniref:M48 family metallopeptidase n=1 Tax=Solimonas variicoloris TaxID=254408 RepID=UPI00037BBB65|nr:M48 family metallopeptidase [Solimonas variicoloris]
MKSWHYATVLIAILVVACATSPTGRRQLRLVSDSEMAQMGATAFQEMKTKTPTTKDTRESSYVQCVARAITTEVGGTWEIQVFDSKEVNAFALPGGKIGVYTGLLKVATTQDQLAAVIGHEISHVLAGHSAARVSNQMAAQFGTVLLSAGTGLSPDLIGTGAQYLVLLPFSRGDESEADILGMQLMARAGFDPAQAITLWQNMSKANGQGPPQFMSTHPSNETRIADLQRNLPKEQPHYQQARAAGKKPNCGTP